MAKHPRQASPVTGVLFRDDLYYRIHVIPIYLPPLRERKEDILPLAEHFLKKYSQQMKREVKGLTPEAVRRLMLHDWAGNVRELENTIEYAVAMTQKDMVTEDYVIQGKQSPAERAGGSPLERQAMTADTLKSLKDARDAFERDYLVQLLSMTEGNVSQAAKLAGKYRADFYDLLKKHDLKVDEFKRVMSRRTSIRSLKTLASIVLIVHPRHLRFLPVLLGFSPASPIRTSLFET